MSHEPECNQDFPASSCMKCILLRAAYIRGRDDATFDIMNLTTSKTIGINRTRVIPYYDALEAARGDWKQREQK